MSPIQISLLGRMEVATETQKVSRFYSQKAAILLARLALSPGCEQGREVLADWLWPDSTPEAGRSSLRRALSSLRAILETEQSAGQVLLANHRHVRLNPSAIHTDVAEFERWLHRAERAEESQERGAALAKSLELYQGEFLPGFYHDWALTERERLARLYCDALWKQARLRESGGDLAGALEVAQRLISQDAWDEQAHRLVLRLLLAGGRSHLALQHYQQFAQRLHSELGIEPEAETRALLRECSQETSIRRAAAGEAQASYSSLTYPLRNGAFFGREPELETLPDLVAQSRLVTVLGPGGVGKTRLVLESLHRSLLDFTAVFVPLASVEQIERVPGMILAALDAPYNARLSALDQLLTLLQDRPLLLILDNFEQLATQGGPLLTTLLERLPRLRVLLTSRQRVHLKPEVLLELSPLLCPAPEQEGPPEDLLRYPGVALFADRARAAFPSLELSSHHLRAIARLCARLDGLPLALEIAAARCSLMLPAQIEAALVDQFRLLTTRHLPVDSRHRSLFAAIQWSERLLSAKARRLLLDLSLFRGGFTLEAALILDPDAITPLEELRDASLLRVEQVEGGFRFSLLETIRAYAEIRCADQKPAPALHMRLLEYFRSLAEMKCRLLEGEQARTALAVLRQEEENFGALLALCQREGLAWEGLRLCNALWRYWQARTLLAEGRQWLDLFLGSETGATTEHTEGWLGLGSLAWGMADWQAAAEALETGIALNERLGNSKGLADCLYMLAQVRHGQGRYEESVRLIDRALPLYRAQQNRNGEANALHVLANNRQLMGENETVIRPLYDQTIALYRQLQNVRRLGAALTHLGVFYLALGQFPESRRLHEEAIRLLREADNRRSLAYALSSYGSLLRETEQRDAACASYGEALHLFRTMGDRQGMASVLTYLGLTYVEEAPEQARTAIQEALLHWREAMFGHRPNVVLGLYIMSYALFRMAQFHSAARLFGAADAIYAALCRDLGGRMAEETHFTRWRQTAEREIPCELWGARHDEGAGLTLEEAVFAALE